ncbi:MAG: hypothetical protein QXG80_00815, partial [Nanopusillaceae archaeon]
YDYNDMQENYMSPRSLVMLSNAIKGVNDYELIENIAIGFLGRVYGMKFANFVRLGDIVGKIYENVELINEYAKQNRLDIIYAFISNLYNRLKDDFNKYEKYIDAILNSNVSADLKYVLVRLLLNDSKLSNVAINKFVKKMKEDIEFEKMVERIMKYVSK